MQNNSHVELLFFEPFCHPPHLYKTSMLPAFIIYYDLINIGIPPHEAAHQRVHKHSDARFGKCLSQSAQCWRQQDHVTDPAACLHGQDVFHHQPKFWSFSNSEDRRAIPQYTDLIAFCQLLDILPINVNGEDYASCRVAGTCAGKENLLPVF